MTEDIDSYDYDLVALRIKEKRATTDESKKKWTERDDNRNPKTQNFTFKHKRKGYMPTQQLTEEQKLKILNHTCMQMYIKGKLTWENKAKRCLGQLCSDCPLPWRYVVKDGKIEEIKVKEKK